MTDPVPGAGTIQVTTPNDVPWTRRSRAASTRGTAAASLVGPTGIYSDLACQWNWWQEGCHDQEYDLALQTVSEWRSVGLVVGVQVNLLSCVRRNVSSRSYPLALLSSSRQSALISSLFADISPGRGGVSSRRRMTVCARTPDGARRTEVGLFGSKPTRTAAAQRRGAAAAR